MEMAREFHPERLSRRGEVITWGLALITLAGLIYVRSQTATLSIWHYVFTTLMLLLAASATLGNWMDRSTVLTIKTIGLHFRNGLRDVQLKWNEIEVVQVFPSRWGDQVHVVGVDAHFSFRILSEFTFRGKTKGRMGFAGGEFIIQTILKNSALGEVDHTESGRYYARP